MPPPATPTVYCLLIVYGTSFNAVQLTLDYGQHQDYAPVQDATLAAQADQVRHIQSVPAALNYLYSQGWESIQTATLPNETSNHYVQGEIGYLLRRRP